MTAAEVDVADARDRAVRDDPIREAVDGLVRDAVIDAEAAKRALAVSGTPQEEIIADATRNFGVRVIHVAFALPSSPMTGAGEWPPPPIKPDPLLPGSETERAAADHLVGALRAGATAMDASAGLMAAGWRSWASERWLPNVGSADGVAPALVRLLREPGSEVGSVVGPVFDPVTGTASAALVVTRTGPGSAIARDTVETAGVDQSYLRSWASTRARERALREDLATSWTSSPQERIRAAELVVGSSSLEGPAGPFVSLAHVVIDQLPEAHRPGSDVAAAATVLGDDLRHLEFAPRVARFQELITAANRTPSADPLKASGELGYFTRDQLIAQLADRAFAAQSNIGDIIGPITTPAGQELFMIRGRFDGVLDDRTSIVLTEARTDPDLESLAARVSPVGEAHRSTGSLWRTLDEFAGSPAAISAYRVTPIGSLSQPFVFGGEVVMVRPVERQTSLVDPDSLARLLNDGFEGWIAAKLAAAAIVRDPEPLPGIRVEPSPSAAASLAIHSPQETIAAPSVGAQATQTFAIPTPRAIP